jgi:hypothetical protein
VGTFWWPAPGTTASADVPSAVTEAIEEGNGCLVVHAPRAAVVMFRGALGQIVGDIASEAAQAKHTLAGQLKQMATDGTLFASLAEWAETVRVLGNAAAHPNELEPVSQPDAEDLARLMSIDR